MKLNPVRWQLKTKFISILLIVLLIPLTSIVLLKEVERSLVESLKQNLLLSTKLYSLQLESNANWFLDSRLPDSESSIADELFVFPLQQTIVLDGFFEEWEFLEHYRANLKVLDKSSDPDTLGFLMGLSGEHLYLSIQVADENIVYPDSNPVNRSELVVISFIDNNNIPQRLFIQPRAPGKIPIKKTTQDQLKIDWRYTAFWAETANGFNLEIKFPSGLKPTHLQIRYYDVDKPGKNIHDKVIASSLLDLNPVIWPSTNLLEYIETLKVNPGQRVWVLDTKGRVMARQGNLQPPGQDKLKINPIVRWLFSPDSSSVVDRRGDKLRLSSPVIQEALTRGPSSTIESNPNSDFSVAIAASPIVNGDAVLGAVMIEENVARVQLVQRQTLSELLYVMSAIILGVVGLIGWYVSKVARRISRLRKQVITLVDEQGRMKVPAEMDIHEGDEIDDLNNAFHKMGNKLYEYHDYLEKLASRLSHELRTPIAIVRSSLDNLLLNHQDEQDVETIKRALAGTERLGEIITRMRQASGVKDAMQSAKFEPVELNEFLSLVIDGFKQTFNDNRFELIKSESPIVKDVSPDLLAELMDKLLSNAIDFSETDKPITVSLNQSKKGITLSVSNYGPTIQKKHLRKIFQSLVSIRDKRNDNTPNLGLGLYVVRLITEFHSAKVKATNKDDGSGVTFTLFWES